jgi:hypothetical protein
MKQTRAPHSDEKKDDKKKENKANAGLGTRSVWAGEDGPRWEGSTQIPLPQRFVRLPRYQ